MTPQQILERASNAQRLLDDPTLQKAFEGVRMSLVAQLEASTIGDVEVHHQIALSLQSLKALRRQLQNWVTDGQVETAKANRNN